MIDKDNLKQVLINLGFIASEKENILKKEFPVVEGRILWLKIIRVNLC
ncbi:hypothetical protein [Cyanobacterium aponinum]|nr:hypothetical protein [Cyanobacterium aponinum]